jgi:hypothetical protein
MNKKNTENKSQKREKHLVIQNDKIIGSAPFPRSIIAAISIYSMIIPVLILDLFIFQYQNLYFRFYKIPRINREDHVVVDRHKLSKLNIFQKLNCIYCGYVNGVFSYAKAIGNQTEIYSCAVKHNVKKEGQEHQSRFYDFKDYQ